MNKYVFTIVFSLGSYAIYSTMQNLVLYFSYKKNDKLKLICSILSFPLPILCFFGFPFIYLKDKVFEMSCEKHEHRVKTFNYHIFDILKSECDSIQLDRIKEKIKNDHELSEIFYIYDITIY